MLGARARQRLLWGHRHLGLWAGALFALLGLTGALQVFYPQLDAYSNPVLRPAAAGPAQVSVQRSVEALRAAFPQRRGSWRIELPLAAGQPIGARYYKPVETAHQGFAPLMATLDPQSYRITSARFWGRYPVTWIYDLHYTLLAGETGHDVVGAGGVALLLSVLLGVWLWLPRPGRVLSALKPVLRQPAVKRVYDLHVLAGVYGAAVLAVIALTGVVLAYPNATKRMASLVLTFDAPMPKPLAGLAPPHGQADLDVLIAGARAVLPQAELRWVETSGDDGREVTLRLHGPGEPSRRFPRTYLKLHPATGEVLYRTEFHRLPAGDWLWAWVHPLHNGEAFGLAGQWLVLATGLLPALLLATGLLRHGHKRQARRQAQAGAARRARPEPTDPA